MSNHKTNNSRRDFLLKSMTLIPAAVIGGSGVGALTAPAPAVAASNTSTQNDYQPTFFTPEEWTFIKAAVARLIRADERGPGALEAGVPEFIDRQMNTPYATGSIWYMQGPFNPDVPKEMGYQLPLVPKQIYNLGIADADAYSKKTAGKPFAELDGAQQDALLQKFESGEVEFQQLPSKLFFSYLLQNTREDFFSDPIHGGNKDMVGWKLIKFAVAGRAGNGVFLQPCADHLFLRLDPEEPVRRQGGTPLRAHHALQLCADLRYRAVLRVQLRAEPVS